MGVLSAFAPTYPWILILRMCVGMGVGGVPQSVTLYSEFLPKKARGRCIMMIEVFWAVGTCAEVLLGTIFYCVQLYLGLISSLNRFQIQERSDQIPSNAFFQFH